MNRLARLCSDNLLISVVVCYMAGAGCAFWFNDFLSPLPVNVIAPALLIFCLLLALCIQPRFRFFITLPFFMVSGVLHTHGALQPVTDSHHIAQLVAQPAKVTLAGNIATMLETNSERTRFTLDCESVLFHGPDQDTAFQPVRGSVLLSIREEISSRYVPGTKVMVMATVDRVRNYQTPGAFDYRLQMASRGIHCSGWIGSQQEIIPLSGGRISGWQAIVYRLEEVRQNTANFLDQHLPSRVSGIYQALLIGSVANISPDTMEAFKANGCFHILSISGLHFSLLGFFCVGVFTFVLKRSTWLLVHTHVPTVALLLTAPILILYTFIAGFNIPTIRSLITALLVLYAVLLRRQQTLVHLIAAAALIVLAFNPLALFTPSFQLSFAAVLAINLIYPRLPLFAENPSDQATTAFMMTALRFVQSMFYVSIAATIGTLPFMLYHFNRVSVVGPIMNLLIEPLLCLWALPCGLLAVPLIPLVPDVAVWILEAGQPGIALALWLSEAIMRFPYTSLWTITPHLVEIVVFFGAAILWFRQGSTVVPRLAAMTLTFLLLGSFTSSLWLKEKDRPLSVSFLDVGQGSATLIQFPDGTNTLVDGGGSQSDLFNPGSSLIAPFLWGRRIWRVHDVIVSHPHEDHYNGLPFIVERFSPTRLIVNGERGEEPAYTHLLQLAEQKGIPLHTANSGEVIRHSADVTFTCLGMNGLRGTGSRLSTNNRSLVFRLQSGDHSYLFPADIELVAENILLRNRLQFDADILLAPHHGSKTSTGPAFLQAVNPKFIVVSASQRRYGRFPDSEHVRTWRQRDIQVLITGQDGTVECISDKKRLRVSTFGGKKYDFSK